MTGSGCLLLVGKGDANLEEVCAALGLAGSSITIEKSSLIGRLVGGS
jgi:hypothetical protein